MCYVRGCAGGWARYARHHDHSSAAQGLIIGDREASTTALFRFMFPTAYVTCCLSGSHFSAGRRTAIRSTSYPWDHSFCKIGDGALALLTCTVFMVAPTRPAFLTPCCSCDTATRSRTSAGGPAASMRPSTVIRCSTSSRLQCAPVS